MVWEVEDQHCHSCGIGRSCSSDSIPGLGTSICGMCGKKEREDVHTYNGILLSQKIEGKDAICNHMGGTRDYHTKPVR